MVDFAFQYISLKLLKFSNINKERNGEKLFTARVRANFH